MRVTSVIVTNMVEDRHRRGLFGAGKLAASAGGTLGDSQALPVLEQELGEEAIAPAPNSPSGKPQINQNGN